MIDRKKLVEVAEQTLRDFSPKEGREWRYSLRMTSGTSASGPLLIIREYPDSAFNRFNGVRNLLLCYGPINIRIGYAHTVSRHHADHPVRILTLDMHDLGDPAIGKLLDDFEPDAIVGFLSFTMECVKKLSPERREAVRLIEGVGELMTEEKYDAFRALLPSAAIKSHYGLNELGFISKLSCGHSAPNQYHPIPDTTVEIDNPDQSGIGEILVSKPLIGDLTVERYRSGDLGRIVPERCPCGEPFMFEVVGRRGIDYIKILGALLRREEFDRVAGEYRNLFSDYRVLVKEREDGKKIGEVTLRLWNPSGAGTPALAHEIAEGFSKKMFVSPTHTFADFVRSGAFLPLIVEFADAPFAQGHKDVKLRKIT